MTIAFSQETRAAGRTNLRPEYRPIIKFKGGTKQYAKITLLEDVDLTDYFQISLFQGGNLIGTNRDKNFKRFDTVELVYNLKPVDSSNKFKASWSGIGADNSDSWSVGTDGGNYHFFTKEKYGAKIPKGVYILSIEMKWSPGAIKNPIV